MCNGLAIVPKNSPNRDSLRSYLDELEHRFNNRDNQFLFRDTLLKLVKAEKLPYEKLTKAA
jgi:hypothetical protein